MNFILSMIGTYPVSLLIKIMNIKDIVNDAAINGFIINLKNFENNANENTSKFEKYVEYIPIINIAYNLNNLIDYKVRRDEYFEIYRTYGYIEPMNKEQENEYNSKPGFFKALNLATKSKKKKTDIENDQIKSSIRFTDKLLDEHELIIEEKNKYKEVSLEELIASMSQEELLKLKDELTTIKKWNELFDDNKEGDFTIKIDKKKNLILRYKCKHNDNN